MTDLVIYYSRTENTKKVAQTIAEEKDAQLLEIKDKKNRSGSINFVKGAIDGLRNKTTSIEYNTVNLADYDTIYIGTPVWASKPTPAINEFIKENDFTNTNVILFTTMKSNGGDKTIDSMTKAIKDKGGNITDSFILIINGKTDIRQITLQALNDQ